MLVTIRLVSTSESGESVYRVSLPSEANFSGTFYVFAVKTESY